MPALDAIRCKMLALGWKEDFVKLRAAAILYNKYNGSLPSNLNELVPEYIPSVPRDMYSGEEVKYNYEKAFFYIIGPDLKDDLGRQEYNWRNLQKDYKGDYKQEIFVDRNTIGERKSLRRMRARRLPSK